MLLYRVRRWLVGRCKHNPSHCAADLLEGDFYGGPGGDQAVEYCHDCGSFRRVFDVWGQRPRYGDWQW